ncbi:hypothetical protein B0H16DRAFT_1813538 [Mycena metata]|uniref:Novel STAND NTPase 1 domain-containing protein n=1 Tax=Mycena metata TaxID=1033252 RepID=A0AAD7ME88_9AGAR|nr:hypothetical protein B0H16DRAFT_1813538 [Mycena metata]
MSSSKMPHQPTITQVRLSNISKYVAITANTFDVLVDALKISGLEAISNTIQSLLRLAQTIKQDKNECAELMECTHALLNAIIAAYIQSNTGAELPPSTLNQIAKFTETLHKIHTFVEAQQSGSKVKKFFRKGELAALLKDCKAGLQQGFDFFSIETVTNAREMQDQAQLRHQEILNMIESLSSLSSQIQHPLSNSISILPAEPKIFYGRDSELADILKHFRQCTPRIAILGAGGMGKTSLARTVVHHEEVATKYHRNRFFVICDTASSKPELAGLIGAHLGMKPEEDLTQAVLQHFSSGPPSLLILDNLETVWEPTKSCREIEELLSLLTDIKSLALVITMRGVERPSKVLWTRPFLLPLPPLTQDAARKMFLDIADDKHSMDEVDQVLCLTDNMPLSISLLAHLVDMEGCKEILSRWETEKTSLISDGYDKRSNLELSISLSLSSPRIASTPQAQDLLALLSMLPDGLSDIELKQAKFPITDILGCKATLLRTALAYTDNYKCLKVLVPIREYMSKLRYIARGETFLLQDISNILSSSGDHRLKAYITTELIRSWRRHPIPHPVPLIVEALNDFKYIERPDLEARFHASLGNYYLDSGNISAALQHGQIALSLAQGTRNLKRQCDALDTLAFIEIVAGDHAASQAHAQEVQRLARISGDVGREARGLYNEALSLMSLGEYQKCTALTARGRVVLGLCGLSHGLSSYALMEVQAQVHMLKSEYVEAHDIHNQIFQATADDNYQRAFTLINLAEINTLTGVPKPQIQKKIDASQAILKTSNNADLNLRDGDMSSISFCRCLQLAWSTNSETGKEMLGIYKALQFLGDVSLREQDEVTATSLFTLALGGFTKMDVHRSRAECMIRLGDISNKHGDFLKALELWKQARPLFERSSQAKQVQHIDERLVGIGEDVKEQHKRYLDQLIELGTPTEMVEEVDEGLSDDGLNKEEAEAAAV